MHAPHTDVPMGDVTYRISRFPARVGSFIAMQLSTKVLPALAGGNVSLQGMPLPSGGAMSEAEFYVLQNHCLAACAIVNDKGAASPIMMADGRLDQRLEYDFPTVMALTIHALKFNVEPFFSEGNPALASLKSLFQSASSSKDSPHSTPTPSVQ
jgi:hypothetical protein